MRLAIRGFANGVQKFEDRLDLPEQELDALLPKLAEKHAKAMADHRYVIEIEFLDEPDPQARFFRFGSDPGGMVAPMAVDLAGDGRNDESSSVYLIQCLCPQRHCIAALAYEADAPLDEKLAEFKKSVAELVDAKLIDPWCGICRSRDWLYETRKTIYRTMEEASVPLATAAAAQAQTREFLRRSKN